jgi:hypothetical protein
VNFFAGADAVASVVKEMRVVRLLPEHPTFS